MADDFWDSINRQVTFDIETLPDGTRRPIRHPVSIGYQNVERATEPMWREARFITDEEMPRDTIIAVDAREGQPTTVTVPNIAWPTWETYYPVANGYQRVERQPGMAPPNAIRDEIQRMFDAMRRSGMDSTNDVVFGDISGVSEAPPPLPSIPEPPPEEVPMPQFEAEDDSLLARLGRLNMTREQRIQHINMMGSGSTPNAIRVQFYNLLTSRGVRQSRGWF